VAAARTAAEQLARAAAHRLALCETETRLASGGPCTAEELVCCLRACAGCDDPSMRARVRGDNGTLLQALQQPEAAAPAAGADLCDATSALLALLGAQLSTAAVPAGAGFATAFGSTSGEKMNHAAMLAALTGALDATSTAPNDGNHACVTADFGGPCVALTYLQLCAALPASTAAQRRILGRRHQAWQRLGRPPLPPQHPWQRLLRCHQPPLLPLAWQPQRRCRPELRCRQRALP